MAVVHGHALCCQPLHITDKGEIAPMNLIRSLSLSQSPFFSFPFLHRKARKSLHLSPDCRSSRTSAWPRPLTSRAPRHASARRPPDARMSPVLFEASRSYSFPPRPPPRHHFPRSSYVLRRRKASAGPRRPASADFICHWLRAKWAGRRGARGRRRWRCW